MQRRGPDGEGQWHSPDGRIALAHRRLAIIDLSPAGAQPMEDPATGNVIVFNGEIYNYRELKRELQAAGHRFRSDSDTEVLLHLYARNGEGMVERLRGMFAFAIWDACAHKLLLARDPLGIKPLYYADDGNTLRFASTVKALIAGGVDDVPSAAGMAGFFLWGHVPEPWTWVEAIRALPAGSLLTVERGKPVAAPRRYFDLREEILAAEQAAPPSRDAIADALAAVEDSVRQHIVADVPVGAFLSAGRDSTLIAALAARHAGEPLRTLTLGFDEYRGTPNDEVPVAERVAELLGTAHTTRINRREDFDAARQDILDAMDQPSIDGVNTWFVARAAAQSGLKVALSGLGGDELFGGYPSFVQVPRLARRMRFAATLPLVGRGFRAVAAPAIRRITNPKWASVAEYGGTLHGAWLLRRALFLPWELPQFMPAELAREGLAALDVEADLRARIQGIRNPQLAVMALEMSGYMRNQLLRDADWAGMANSLEIRVPLVDATLLRRWLPIAAHRFPLDRQRLLEAADARVAAVVGARPKSGFSVPVREWLMETQPEALRHRGLRGWALEIFRRFAAGPSAMGDQVPASSWLLLGRNKALRRTVPSYKGNGRILIFRYGQLGDTLVALPAIRAVREHFPKAELTLLCDRHENSGFVTADQVLPSNLVDRILTYEANASGMELRSAISLLRRLRAEKFDTLVYLAPRLRSKGAVLRDLIFFHIGGVRRVFGHHGFSRLPRRSTGGGPLPRVRHEADHLLERIRLDGIAGSSSSNGMDLELTESEHCEAEQWLRSRGVTDEAAWLIAFGPGSKWPSKRWPEGRFLELGKRLLGEYGFTPVVVGGPEDRALGERLTSAWRKGLNAAGELSVRGSAALLARCRMFVGNDNGVMHLAAAVGTPCVAIFAAQDWPGRWDPYGIGHRVLRRHPTCEGCKLMACTEHGMRCLLDIGVDEVLTACRELVRGDEKPVARPTK